MTYEEIETFLMAVKTRNVTKTAEALFISQPTVSHRLKSLEEELGLHLLIRKKGYKQIELTPNGKAFLPVAERWVSLWQDTRLLRYQDEKLDLIVGCTDTINAVLFMDLYSSLLKEDDPSIRLKIKTHYSNELYELLEKHEIDIGFVYHYLQFRNVVTEPILRERMCYVERSEGKKKRGTSIQTDVLDLSMEVFFSWETNYQIWHDQWISQGRQPLIQIDTYELLLHFMKEAGRWCIAPFSVAQRLSEQLSVEICAIDTPVLPPERTLYQIRHKFLSETKQRALDVFETHLENYLSTKSWNKY